MIISLSTRSTEKWLQDVELKSCRSSKKCAKEEKSSFQLQRQISIRNVETTHRIRSTQVEEGLKEAEKGIQKEQIH